VKIDAICSSDCDEKKIAQKSQGLKAYLS